MKETIDIFQSALQHLKNAVDKTNKVSKLEGLLAAYFCRSYRPGNASGWNVYCDPSEWIKKLDIDLDQSPEIAIMGCLLHEEFCREGHISSEPAAIFTKYLGRLQNRKNIFQSSASWIYQPSIVLAIAIGIKVTRDEILKQWMLDIIDQGLKYPGISLFMKLTYLHVCILLDGKNDRRLATYMRVDLTNYSVFELSYAVWLVTKQMLIEDNDRQKWLDEANSNIIFRLVTETGDWGGEENFKNAIVLDVALVYLRSRSFFPSTDMLTSILQGFEPAMERWKAHWSIENEYDVQAILWLLLRPYFEDLRYEENLAKLGRSGQRYDFGIPSLDTIVEVKFARKKDDFKKIVNEIGVDSAQLLPQTDFREIVVFTYDNSCSVEQHDWAERTLKGITFVRDAIIVSAPSSCRKKE